MIAVLSLRTDGESAIRNGPETLRQQRPALTNRTLEVRMAAPISIDICVIRQLLTYDAETGRLVWQPRPLCMFKTQRHCSVWNARYANGEAFTSVSGGHRIGAIFDRKFKAHRVAWAIFHGEWPDGDIDHINGDGLDNRISNLRVVSHRMNMQNVKRRRDSASGVTGVCWFKRYNKWMARIGTKHIGYFDTLEAATAARRAAEAEHGFHSNHGRAR